MMTTSDQQVSKMPCGGGGEAAVATTGPVRPTLDELTQRVRTALEQAEGACRRALVYYRDIGNALLLAKAIHGEYGNWLPWLQTTGIKQQRASEYMRLAEGWDKLPPSGDFSLKEALEVIREAEDAMAGQSPAADGQVSPRKAVAPPGAGGKRRPPGKTYVPALRDEDLLRFPQVLAELRPVLQTDSDGDTLREAVYWCHARGVARG